MAAGWIAVDVPGCAELAVLGLRVCCAPHAGWRGCRGASPQCWATHIPPATAPQLAGCFVPTVSLRDVERRSSSGWGEDRTQVCVKRLGRR